MKPWAQRWYVQAITVLTLAGLAYWCGRKQWLVEDIQAWSISASTKPQPVFRLPPPPRPKYYPAYQVQLEIANFAAGRWTHANSTRKMKASDIKISVMHLDPKDFPALVAAVRKLPPSADRDIILDEMLTFLTGMQGRQNLAYGDAVLAVDLLHELPDSPERQYLMDKALIRLSAIDPQQVIQEMEKLQPGVTGVTVYSSLYMALARQDPAQATALALALPAGSNREFALGGIAAALAETDLQGAIAWVGSQTMNDAERTRSLSNILRNWGVTDREAAIQWAAGLPPEDATVFSDYLRGISGTDPILAAKYLDLVTDAAARDEIVMRMVQSYMRVQHNDPAATLEWLNQVASGGTYETAVNKLVASLTRPAAQVDVGPNGDVSITSGRPPDFNQALVLLDGITDAAARTSAISTLASNWSKTSVAAALGWAESLAGAENVAALNAIVSTWAKTDPAAAFAYVQKSSEPSKYLDVAPVLAKAAAAVNPEQALAFVQSLPEGDTKNLALNNALASAAKTDFSTAWTYATNFPDSSVRDTAMTNLVGIAAAKDPAQAVALLDQFAAGTAQRNATATLAQAWVAQDPQAASVWMDTLPIGQQRNAAVVVLVAAQAGKDPAAALQWANTITNPPARTESVQNVIVNWAKTDQAAAHSAVPAANLTAAQKASLLQLLTQAGPAHAAP